MKVDFMITRYRATFMRGALLAILLALASGGFQAVAAQQEAHPDRPNVVIIFTDDLGYGDLGPYGHPTIHTPHLDRMAREGMKFTQFYVGASVCTPSRAALLTGRLPVRSGMASDESRVLFPNSRYGIPEEEVLIPEALKEEGYATAHVGKWHLGHRDPYLPTNNGFDYYYGIPYSNDMDRTDEAPDEYRASFEDPKIDYFSVPLMQNEKIIERPANQHTITRRYTEEAVRFIEENQDQPFFLYLAHNLPHVPLFRSDRFKGKSERGLYGDVIEELDWSTGQVLQKVEELDLEENTLVFFTSDNGPWLIFDEQGGSAGLLRGGKGSTWEGGMREPAIAWWPGTVEAGTTTDALATTMDLFATALQLGGAEVPQDRVIDGVSLMPVFQDPEEEVREEIFYYRGERLYAVRKGPWKMHLVTQAGYGDEPHPQDPPLLFHLGHDPSEKYDVAEEHPEVIRELRAVIEEHRANLKRGEDRLEARGEQWVTNGDS